MQHTARAIAAVAGLSILLAHGCGRNLATSESAFAGPPVELTAVDTWHTVRVTTPTPGWKAHFDQSRPTLDGRAVFITLTEPDPRFVYPQVMVEQLIATDVPSDQAVIVYVRTLASDQKSSDGVYFRAGSANLDAEP